MTLGEAVRSWNFLPIEAENIGKAREIFNAEELDVVLLDIDLPDGSGLDFLTELKETNPEVVVVMITGNISVPNTIAALRGGAHDFIGKPVRLEELRVTLRNAVEIKNLRREVKQARNNQKNAFSFDQIIGESIAITQAKNLAEKVAVSDVGAILLQGETGTGKDLFARAIHYASERADAPYLAINCAALPANLIESELFGYEKGAFTDAKQKKEGLLEQAHGGTIFLDEIGEMELGLQAKLLRVLEENTFRRVGGLRDISFDARIVAASNKHLKEESEHGNFRLDLFYRLSVIQIDIPPLRERGDDCLILAQYFIEKNNYKRRDVKLKGLAKKTEEIFKKYEWKGNVREMRNVIERASILEEGELITTAHLPADLLKTTNEIAAHNDFEFTLPPDGISLEEVEAELARQAFDRTDGNLTQAAKLLNISRDQLRYKLKKSGDYELKD